jgi:hypothetical protein
MAPGISKWINRIQALVIPHPRQLYPEIRVIKQVVGPVSNCVLGKNKRINGSKIIAAIFIFKKFLVSKNFMY